MECPECHAEIKKDTAKFCPKCGTPIRNAASASAVESGSAPEPEPAEGSVLTAVPAPASDHAYARQGKRDKPPIWAIVLIVLAVISLVAVVVVFVNQPKEEPEVANISLVTAEIAGWWQSEDGTECVSVEGETMTSYRIEDTSIADRRSSPIVFVTKAGAGTEIELQDGETFYLADDNTDVLERRDESAGTAVVFQRSEEPEVGGRPITQLEKELQLLDGWWVSEAVTGGRHVTYYHLKDGVGLCYQVLDDTVEGEPTAIHVVSIEHLDAIDVITYSGSYSDAERSKPGYYVLFSNDIDQYLLDEDRDTLRSAARALTMYRAKHAPSWANDDVEAAVQSGDAGAASQADDAAPAEDAEASAQAAKQAAIDAALAEGMQVFTGRVEVTDYNSRMSEAGYPEEADSSYNHKMVVLLFDPSVECTGASAGKPYDVRQIESMQLAADYERSDLSSDMSMSDWAAYDGQVVTVAVDNVVYPTDISYYANNAVPRTLRFIG